MTDNSGRLRIVGIAGNVRQPSRTRVLVQTALGVVERQLGGQSRFFELAEIAPHILSALTRDRLSEEGLAVVEAIERSDLLIVGTPIYRASYTGALKHLFDLIHNNTLIGKPALLLATGGTPLHGLVTEHQMRPLLSYFSMRTIPTTVYALESDFDDFELTSPEIHQRIERAVAELVSAARAAA